MRLNSEGHDESQYLPKKWFNPKTEKEEPYPVVNSFRAAKGDIARNADDKLECSRWMPRILNLRLGADGNKVLDDDCLHTCRRVERCVLSAMAALGMPSVRNFIAGDMSVTTLADSDPFKALLVGMHPKYSTALLWLVCDERNRGNVDLAMRILGTILQAIEHAKKILDEVDDARKLV